MHKLFLILIGIMFVSGSITAQETDNWKQVLKNFSYKSNGFSCTIDRSGVIRQLTADNMLLIQYSCILGNYKILKDKKHDNRFFQAFERKYPLFIKQISENSYEFKKTGTLSNKKYKPGAKYTEKIILSQNQIEFKFELELLTPLASQSRVFCSLIYLPPDTFSNRGFRLTKSDGKSKLMVFPQTYSKDTKLHISSIKNIMISLQNGVFEIVANEGSHFAISDTRSYKGKNFRIDISENTPWKSKATVFPKGKIFKWSYKYIYKKTD